MTTARISLRQVPHMPIFGPPFFGQMVFYKHVGLTVTVLVPYGHICASLSQVRA